MVSNRDGRPNWVCFLIVMASWFTTLVLVILLALYTKELSDQSQALKSATCSAANYFEDVRPRTLTREQLRERDALVRDLRTLAGC